MDSLEIERKFFVAPNNPTLLKLLCNSPYNIEERYYLYRHGAVELRITKITKPSEDNVFNLDRMELQITTPADSHIIRRKDRLLISEEEFQVLLFLVRKKDSKVEPIVRWSYLLKGKPKIEIKVYKGKFNGLIRLEVEFASIKESEEYQTPQWVGEEITDTMVGRDVSLPDLTSEKFKEIISKLC